MGHPDELETPTTASDENPESPGSQQHVKKKTKMKKKMKEKKSPSRSASPASASDGDSNSDPSTSKTALPPDGGWGWVIVICSFFCNGVVDGSCSTFGVFQPYFVDHFQASNGKIAMAGSLMAGFFMMTGPLASALVNAVGSRVVTISGGVIATAALLLSTFSTSVDMLILTYGLMGGIGLGLIYLPAMVMVGHYFEKRRALAFGISCSGAGVGMFIMSSVAAILLGHFDWKNSMMIVAGFPLQCVFLGALMRPLYAPLTTGQGSLREIEASDTPEKNPCTENKNTMQSPVNRSCSEALNKNVGLREQLFQHHLYDGHGSDPKVDKENDKWPNAINGKVKNGFTLVDSSSCHEIPIRTQQHSDLHHLKVISKPVHVDKKAKSCHNLSNHAKGDPEFTKEPVTHRHRHLHPHRKDLNKPLLKKDIFYSGSIYNLPEYKTNPDMHSYMASITNIQAEELSSDAKSGTMCRPCLSDSSVGVLKEMLDVTIFTHPQFLVLAAASTFIQLAYFVPIMFVTRYALSLGLDSARAAFLVSAMGISNTVGRALAGALANVPRVPVLHLNNFSLIVAGIGTILVTLVCKDFPSLVVYSCVFGLCLGAFVPLGTIFLVKYLGLHRLTNAFGQLSFVRGLATMAGPPIAGALLDVTGDFELPFIFAGTMLVIAGLVHYLLPVVQRWQGHPKDGLTSFAVVAEVETDVCTADSMNDTEGVVSIPVTVDDVDEC